MRQLTKEIFTWLGGLYNLVLYYLTDGLGNLIEQQANKLIHQYQLVELQQAVLIILDVFSNLFMLITILILFIVNQPRICSFFSKGYAKIKALYQKLTKTKPVA